MVASPSGAQWCWPAIGTWPVTILVFGKNGQVATELQRDAKVTALGRAACDITQQGAIAEAIEAYRPSCVINAAAYTAVDRAQEDPTQAHLLNAVAPGAMAETCAKHGIPFLHISTDYVFDGRGTDAWKETDTPAPRNVYGHSKRAGEIAVAQAGGQWAVLRTSWVFSAHGQNFVKTMLRLAQSHDTLTIVSDQIGGPTPAADIAQSLLRMAQAMRDGHAGGLYHFAGLPVVSWADFAREIFAASHQTVRVIDIPTTQYPTPAVRPMNSRLDCAKLTADFGITPPDWRIGLSAVLKELAII